MKIFLRFQSFLKSFKTLFFNQKKSEKDKPKRKLKQKPGLKCLSCGTTETPEWRKGPQGSNTLCNACGIRWSKKMRAQKELAAKTATTGANSSQPNPVNPSSNNSSSSTSSQMTTNNNGNNTDNEQIIK